MSTQYNEASDEEKAEIIEEHNELYSNFLSAQSELKYADLVECQTLEAEAKAITEAKRTYEHINKHLDKVLEALNEVKEGLEDTKVNLVGQGVAKEGHFENAKCLTKITTDIDNLITEMNENDITKFTEINDKLDSALSKMKTDYDTRAKGFTSLKKELRRKSNFCIEEYNKYYEFFYNHGLNCSPDFMLDSYTQDALFIFNYLEISF